MGTLSLVALYLAPIALAFGLPAAPKPIVLEPLATAQLRFPTLRVPKLAAPRPAVRPATTEFIRVKPVQQPKRPKVVDIAPAPTPGLPDDFVPKSRALVVPVSPLAHPGSSATRMDLLTVVLHELGHALGLTHDDEDELAIMAPTLRGGSSVSVIAGTARSGPAATAIRLGVGLVAIGPLAYTLRPLPAPAPANARPLRAKPGKPRPARTGKYSAGRFAL